MIPLFKVLMSPDAKHRVAEVLESGYVAQGPKVKEFEEELGKILGGPVLTVNSCTSALDLAMHLCGVGPGTEVLTSPLSCSATNSPIVTKGARPVWVDINPTTGLISPSNAADKITNRTVAVVVVDWEGRACDYDSLRKVIPSHIPIIRDAAHSFGNPTPGGDYICWSLQAIKHLTAGDGGILRVPEEQYQRVKLLRWYGLDREGSASFRCQQNIQEVGYKYHMNDIAATIGLANLPLALECLNKNRKNAKSLYDILMKRSYLSPLTVPSFDTNSSYWFFTVLAPRRDHLIEYCREHGFETSPVHARNDKHVGFNYPNGILPGVDYFSNRNVGIPVGWWLTTGDIEMIGEALSKYEV